MARKLAAVTTMTISELCTAIMTIEQEQRRIRQQQFRDGETQFTEIAQHMIIVLRRASSLADAIRELMTMQETCVSMVTEADDALDGSDMATIGRFTEQLNEFTVFANEMVTSGY